MAGRVDSGTTEQVPEKEVLPQAPPLRQPHCTSNKPSPRKEEDAMPALTEPKKPQYNNNNKQQDTRNNRGPRNNNNSPYNKNRQGHNDRRQQRQDEPNEQEDWGNKNSTARAASPPAKPCPKPVEAAPPAAAPPTAKPQEEPRPKAVPKAPGSLTDTTPATKGGKKLVPENYLIDLLSPGDTALLSVEATAADCRAPRGFVCLSMHERFETQYQDLCEQYAADCEAETAAVTPAPGDTFSYFNPADGGWYRARLLTASCAALLDASKLAALPADKLRPLPARYAQPPEFCCLLTATVQVGDSLTCKLMSKTPDGWKVSLSKVDTGAVVGEGEVTRWLPAVEYPAPVAVPTPAPAASTQIPEVPRPDVINNSRVVLVDATGFERAFVRPSDAASQRRFDQTLEEVVMYARTAAPLSEPPQKGQVVIGKFTDGLFYRALCKRTSVKQNKYMLEYIEFGNVEVTSLENIYPCPMTLQLAARPAEASLVTLQCKAPCVFSAQATEYLDTVKDELQELILTLPSGEGTAPSGASVCLAEVRTNESLNRKLETMCTPDWKKLEEKGADVVELKPLMYADLECLELPPDGGALEVLDVSALAQGSLSACPARHPHAAHVLGALTEQMAEYCNSDLGKKPYLPKLEELCIARFPPYPQWFRAVLLEQTPGSATARVCYVDYGNVAEVPVEHLRKMLPEFVRGRPALASHLDIRDFPKNPTPEMLARAVEHMRVNDEGRGALQAARCDRLELGLYAVHAPDLIRAMTQ